MRIKREGLWSNNLGEDEKVLIIFEYMSDPKTKEYKVIKISIVNLGRSLQIIGISRPPLAVSKAARYYKTSLSKF